MLFTYPGAVAYLFYEQLTKNKAYYTDDDPADLIYVPEKEDSTQHSRSVRELNKVGELRQNDNSVPEKTIDYKEFQAGESNGMYKDVIFFLPRKADVNNENIIDEVVIWYNNHPGKTIYLRGYADKETGNKQLNLQLSSMRVNSITDLLTRKGVPADKIKTHAYGDTIQLFTESGRNRCAIIDIK